MAARAHTLLAALVLLLAVEAAPASADSLQPPALASPAAASQVKTNPVFTWSAVPRAARYEIQVSTSSVFSGTAVYTAVVRSTTATPTFELPLGSLYWRVLTIDGTGQKGVYSATRSFERVLADGPELTSPSHATTLSFPTQPAVLSWKPIPSMESYRVQLDDEASFTGATQYETASSNFALPSALPSNAPRFWRVQGVTTNPGVTTAWSDAGDLRSFSIAWPSTSKPTTLTPADAIDVDIDDFEFSWTAVPGAARYQIETSTAPDFTAGVTSEVVHGTRYRPLSTMTQDQYFWRVRALQANGEATQWSTTSSFKREWLDGAGQQARPELTLADHDPLVPGAQLEVDRLYFWWTPIRRASYYEIQFFNAGSSTILGTCKSAHARFTPHVTGTYTETSFAGACGVTFQAGKAYTARVRAVEETTNGQLRTTVWSDTAREGEGGAPPAQSFQVLDKPPTGTPAGEPGVIIGSPNSEGSPRLTWERALGAVSYKVVLARDSSFNTPVGTFTTTNTEFVINQMLLDNTAGQPYFWFVLPCVKNPDATTTCAPENSAINIAGRYGTFNKLGKAVAGLTADPVQTDTVTLSWQDHLTTSPDGGGVKSYEVEVRNASDVLVGGTVRTDATGYTPMNSAYPDGQYTWRVRAIDASGTGLAWGNGGGFEVKSSVPTPLPVADDPSPVLKWTPTSFAASYDVEVYRGVNDAFPNASKVASASVNARPYPVYAPTAALAAATYSWRVRQVDAYGNKGAWSTAVLPFTIGGTAPTHVAPAHGGFAPAPSMVFDWSNVPGAVRYQLETSTTEGFGTNVKSVTTTGTRYAPTDDYVGGTVYWWRVSALNASNDTLATSAPTSFTAQTTPLTTVASAKVSGLQLEVNWSKPGTGGSEITAYHVRYRKLNTTAWTEANTAGDVTSLTFGDLERDTTYEAQVAAHNAVGTGPFSASVTVKTPTVPGAPTSLALTPAVRTLTATWKAPAASGGTPVTGYVVRIAPTNGGTPVQTEVTGLTTQFTDLADSTSYTVDVAAKNEVGRGDFASAQMATPALPAAPDTAIAGTDDVSIATQTASFTFSSTPATGNTFECRLDDGEYEPCTSPKQFTGLAEGPHSVRVRARDAYGQYDPTPAVRTFTVDLTAPDTTILGKPLAATTQTTANFTYAGAPAADVARFECKLDSGPYATCEPAGKTYSVSPGSHTFSVRAVDKAGNADASPDAYTWTVDTSAPDTVLPAVSGPAQGTTVNSKTAQFAFNSEAGAHFECKLDGGEYETCESPVSYAGLADGSHSFSVRAVDAAGNKDASPATRTWTVDVTAPDTVLAASGPTGRVKATTAQFAFSSEAAARFECKLDDGEYAACTAPKAYADLTEGEHTFAVRAIDTPGNVDATPATRTWTVDLTPPETSLQSGPSGTVNSPEAEFGFVSEPGATFQCKLDGGAYMACASPKSYSGMAVGQHTFSVRAVDAAGNVDATPDTRSWTVDFAAPNTDLADGPRAFNTASPSFSFASEAGASFECRLDDGQFEACTSPHTYEDLAEGSHTFTVRARDAAGNADPTPAVRPFTVDLTAPDTQIDSGPQASTTATTAAFTYSGTPDDAVLFECKLDAEPYGACPVSYTVAVGAHSFSVRAVDRAGNVDATPATFAWTVTKPSETNTGTTPTGNTPSPTSPGGTAQPTEQALVTSGLGRLPGSAGVGRSGRSFTINLPAGAFPDGTVVSFKLTSGSSTIGAGRVTTSPGKASRVTIKLTAKGRRTLKAKKKLKATLTATATAPGGVKGTRSRTLTLKLRR